MTAGMAQGHAHGDRQRIETLENELAVMKNEQTQSSHGKFLPCSPPPPKPRLQSGSFPHLGTFVVPSFPTEASLLE